MCSKSPPYLFLWLSAHTYFYSSSCGLSNYCGWHLLVVVDFSFVPTTSALSLPLSSLILPPRCGSDPFYCIPAPLLVLQFRSSSSRPGSYSSLQMGIHSLTIFCPSCIIVILTLYMDISKPEPQNPSIDYSTVLRTEACSFRRTFKALNPQTVSFLTGLTLH